MCYIFQNADPAAPHLKTAPGLQAWQELFIRQKRQRWNAGHLENDFTAVLHIFVSAKYTHIMSGHTKALRVWEHTEDCLSRMNPCICLDLSRKIRMLAKETNGDIFCPAILAATN